MKIGLALSGGGARGIAHLGVLKAFDEHGIKFSAISGTSAGAIVGALYAYGHTPDEILEMITRTSFVRSLRLALAKTGLLRIDQLGDLLLKYLPENDFGCLKIPLTVAATDIVKGETTYFSEGALVNAILASSCIPVIFDPLKYNGSFYVDGGILDNLPVEPLTNTCDFIIGCHTNPIDNNFDLRNVKTLIERSLLMAINGNTQKRRELCQVFIEPPALRKYGGMELGKAKELFDIGYEYTKSNIGEFNILR
ncbi:patatin-like phospholipase family protein [Fulvivirgaceae bacterium BMA10]|uniref:Patatin-like phospholipase family protein n=1 Tax=Splendidivirga corallicola TaxID=3051826 RepID=A0ABT8KTR9_9BACT|nr:patatin-like phospholipase family protein [Fulvivirgaceae bacterium BMA10]